MTDKAVFPWSRLLQSAFMMGLSPQEFWQLTPYELHCLLAPPEPRTMTRTELTALMELYPDQPEGKDDE